VRSGFICSGARKEGSGHIIGFRFAWRCTRVPKHSIRGWPFSETSWRSLICASSRCGGAGAKGWGGGEYFLVVVGNCAKVVHGGGRFGCGGGCLALGVEDYQQGD